MYGHTEGEDFAIPGSALSIDVSGPANQQFCIEFATFLDGRVEPLERFTVGLNTDDSTVSLEAGNETEVLLIDSDGKILTASSIHIPI